MQRERRHYIRADEFLSTLSAIQQFVKKDNFCRALIVGASVAPMTGSRHELTGNEQCTGLFSTISGGLKIHRYTGGKLDNKWSLTGKNLKCSEGDTAVDAGMNMVPMVSAWEKMQIPQSMRS